MGLKGHPHEPRIHTEFFDGFRTPRPVLQCRRDGADGGALRRSFWRAGSCATLGIAGRRASASGDGSAAIDSAIDGALDRRCVSNDAEPGHAAAERQ